MTLVTDSCYPLTVRVVLYRSCQPTLNINSYSFLVFIKKGAIKAGEETYAGMMALFNAIRQK